MPQSTQHSYLLRLWRERSETPWRVTLIAIAQPDEHRHFETLDACFAFLYEQFPTPDGLRTLLPRSVIVAQMEGNEK